MEAATQISTNTTNPLPPIHSLSTGLPYCPGIQLRVSTTVQAARTVYPYRSGFTLDANDSHLCLECIRDGGCILVVLLFLFINLITYPFPLSIPYLSY